MPLTIIAVSPIPEVNSNFALMDRLAGHNTRYYHAFGTEVVRPPASKFLTSFRLPNPQRVAREIIRLVKDEAKCLSAPGHVSPKPTDLPREEQVDVGQSLAGLRDSGAC
jgi:hypothetical protein